MGAATFHKAVALLDADWPISLNFCCIFILNYAKQQYFIYNLMNNIVRNLIIQQPENITNFSSSM